jgi:hypothetical protein
MKQDASGYASLPEMFRPLLWSYRFEELDPEKHRDEIIVQTINHGNLDHWRWIIDRYGKATIRKVLEGRLGTEFYPEFRNLARVIFSVNDFRHARGSTN